MDLFDILSNKENTYDGDLKHYFRVLWNSPNVSNPYHNIEHILGVTSDVYEGAMFYIKKYNSVTRRDLRSILISALFHDYNHIGAENDSANIELAINGLRTYILPIDKPEFAIISENIKGTQFPHSNKEMTLCGNILKDADISYTLTDNWFKLVCFDLSNEINKSAEDMIRFQETFLKNIWKVETEWAKLKYSPIVEKRLEQISKIIEFTYGK